VARSMTGFGRASARSEAARVTVTLRSVNHRGLKLTSRVSDSAAALAPELEARLRATLARGAVTLDVYHRALGGAARYRLDRACLATYLDEITELVGTREGEPLPLRTELVAQLPGVIEELPPDEVDLDEVRAVVAPVFEEALRALSGTREREGAALEADVRGRAAAIRERLNTVRAQAPEETARAIERARARVVAFLEEAGAPADEAALSRELAALSERSAVSEELCRLDAHLQELDRVLASDQPIGRRLEFLAQELLREANTTAQKCTAPALLQAVLDIKVEVDRIREQVANIE